MGMRVEMKLDVSTLRKAMEIGSKRAAYAMATTINRLADLTQDAEKDYAKTALILRRKYVITQVAFRGKVLGFANATKGKLWAEVEAAGENIGGEGGRYLLLPRMVRGGIKHAPHEPTTGEGLGWAARAGYVAIPITGGVARRSPISVQPLTWQMRSLRFRKQYGWIGQKKPGVRRGLSRGGAISRPPEPKPISRRGGYGRTYAGSGGPWRGEHRTFVIPGKGVMRRIGKGEAEWVYIFKREVRLPPRLAPWYAIANKVVRDHLYYEAEHALDLEMIQMMQRGH